MTPPRSFEHLDVRITHWMADHGVALLQVSLGIVFFWFGVLKYMPGLSPAESLATDTIGLLTGGRVGPRAALIILATWESLIGLGLIFGKALRVTLLLLFLQMPGTVLPIFFFPDQVFRAVPFVLTMEGQYIVKNLVLVSAALVIGATVRGGRMVAEKDEADEAAERADRKVGREPKGKGRIDESGDPAP